MELPSPKPVNYFRLQNTCSSVPTKYHKDSSTGIGPQPCQFPGLSGAPGQRTQTKATSTCNHSSGPVSLHSYASQVKLLSLPVWCKETPLCQQGSGVIINKTFSAKGAVINAPELLEGGAMLMGGSINLAEKLFPQQNPCNTMRLLSILLKVRPFPSSNLPYRTSQDIGKCYFYFNRGPIFPECEDPLVY